MSKPIEALREKQLSAVKNALAKISEKHGHITPEFVVQEARNVKNPLHNSFEWDDTEAGNLYRLTQARFLIRTVKLDIIRKGEGNKEITLETTRAYVAPQSKRGKESYIKLKTAMDDAEIRTEMIQMAKAELKVVKNKYNQIVELSEVWDAIEMI